MLSTLSLRNARRQAKDYLIYFITLVLSASSIFALMSLLFSKDVTVTLQEIKIMRSLMGLVFVVVAVTLSWLIQYMMNFILARRSRELATYLLLGVRNQKVAQIFLRENVVIGAAALLAGYVGGGILYQALKAVTLHLMGEVYRLQLDYSLGAMGITALLFVAVYLLSALRSSHKIRKLKLCELLYYENKNEKPRRAHRVLEVLTFCLSLAAFAVGIYFLEAQPLGSGDDFSAGLVCIVLFLYFFFTSFPNFVVAVLGRGCWKYRGRRIIVLRNFTAKLGTMGKTTAFLSILFTASLALFAAVLLSISTLNYRADMVPFDFSIISEAAAADFTPYQRYVAGHFDVQSEAVYPIYQSDSKTLSGLRLGLTLYNYRSAVDFTGDLCMAASDYARLRAMLGYDPVHIGAQECVVQCFDYDNVTRPVRAYVQQHPTLTINGQVLRVAGVHTEDFDQYDGFSNGRFILIVVPDEIAKTMQVCHTKYSVITARPMTVAQCQSLRDAFPQLVSFRLALGAEIPQATGFLDAKAELQKDNGGMMITMMMPLWYVAFMLCITGITVLVSNVISEEKRCRQEFSLLRSLGYPRSGLEKIVVTQLGILFLVPLAPALVLAAVLAGMVASNMGATMFVPAGALWGNILLGFGIYLGVYLLYFGASCLLLCRGAIAAEQA